MISLLSIYFSFIFILALGEFSEEKNSRLRVVGAPYVRPAVVICTRMVSLHEPMLELTGWAHRGDTFSENLVRRHKTTVAGLYVGDNTSRRPVRGLGACGEGNTRVSRALPFALACVPLGAWRLGLTQRCNHRAMSFRRNFVKWQKQPLRMRSLDFMGRRRSVGENARVSAVSVPNGELGIQKIKERRHERWDDSGYSWERCKRKSCDKQNSGNRCCVALSFAFFFLPPEMHFVLWGTLSKGQGASCKQQTTR